MSRGPHLAYKTRKMLHKHIGCYHSSKIIASLANERSIQLPSLIFAFRCALIIIPQPMYQRLDIR